MESRLPPRYKLCQNALSYYGKAPFARLVARLEDMKNFVITLDTRERAIQQEIASIELQTLSLDSRMEQQGKGYLVFEAKVIGEMKDYMKTHIVENNTRLMEKNIPGFRKLHERPKGSRLKEVHIQRADECFDYFPNLVAALNELLDLIMDVVHAKHDLLVHVDPIWMTQRNYCLSDVDICNFQSENEILHIMDESISMLLGYFCGDLYDEMDCIKSRQSG